jgi:hypothetical protein
MSSQRSQYVAPMPNENTYDSQEEFLDSFELARVPKASLEDGGHRCAHCWKFYGDSDPGFDNAEGPVKFRCGHIFGEECMRDLFTMPPTEKIPIGPISFEPGTFGALLGHMLDNFVGLYARAHAHKHGQGIQDSTPHNGPPPHNEAASQQAAARIQKQEISDLSASPEDTAKVLGIMCTTISEDTFPLHGFRPWQHAISAILNHLHPFRTVRFINRGVLYDFDKHTLSAAACAINDGYSKVQAKIQEDHDKIEVYTQKIRK